MLTEAELAEAEAEMTDYSAMDLELSSRRAARLQLTPEWSRERWSSDILVADSALGFRLSAVEPRPRIVKVNAARALAV